MLCHHLFDWMLSTGNLTFRTFATSRLCIPALASMRQGYPLNSSTALDAAADNDQSSTCPAHRRA